VLREFALFFRGCYKFFFANPQSVYAETQEIFFSSAHSEYANTGRSPDQSWLVGVCSVFCRAHYACETIANASWLLNILTLEEEHRPGSFFARWRTRCCRRFLFVCLFNAVCGNISLYTPCEASAKERENEVYFITETTG
jgi:hypothetical protein